MNTFSRYLCWRVTQYVFLTLLIVVMSSLAFELMQEWDDVMRTTQVSMLPLARYTWLRLPETIAQSLPIASVIGGIFLMGVLMRNSELVAAWAGGTSAFRLIRGLWPFGLVLVVFHFILIDRIVPHSLTALYEWQVGDYRRDATIGTDSEAVWLRSGSDIVRIPAVQAQNGFFRDATIFRRSEEGILIEQIDLADARPVDGGWELRDVVRHSARTGETVPKAILFWDGHLSIENLPLISADIRELSLAQISTLIENEGFGQRPTSLYNTWFHSRLSSALTPFLLICLVASLSQRFRRSGGIGLLIVTSLGISFAFLVFDNTAFAFGEAGFTPPLVAGWLPKLTLSLLIAFFIVRNEG